MRSTQINSSSGSTAASFLKSALASSRGSSDMASTMAPKSSLQISQRISSAVESSSQMEYKSVMRNKQEHPEKLIDEATIFKAAMTSDWSKILELSIVRENITRLDNTMFRQLAGTLRKLDMSFNHIERIENIECLINLRELEIPFNNIQEIDGLTKQTNMRTLNLDYNKISRIQNVKHMRKLEKLSLNGNQIKELSSIDTTEPMLELRELNLDKNQIKSVEVLHNFPKLEDLHLSGNPLTMIFPEAMSQLKNISAIKLNNVKFRWPKEDLIFLKKVESTLTSLHLNNAFPKQNLEDISDITYLSLGELAELNLKGNGIINITGIDKLCKNITVLDLTNNKITSVEAIEELHRLENLAEISFKDNPVCVHKHLQDMVSQVVPSIEMVNHEQLQESGHRFKVQMAYLKNQILDTSGQGVGTRVGDRLIEEANSDPDFKFNKGQNKNQSTVDSLNNLINQDKKNEKKTTQLFNELEKNFGLNVKTLNDYADPEDEAAKDPTQDLEIFQEVIKHTYGDLKRQHRDVVDNLRETQQDAFFKIAKEKEAKNRVVGELVYSRIDQETQKLKIKMEQVNDAQGFLGADYVREMDNKARTFRDFYQAPDSDGISDDSDDSESDEDAKSDNGHWQHPALRKKTELMTKKAKYANQLKRAMPAKETTSKYNPNASQMSSTTSQNLPPRIDSAVRSSKEFVIGKRRPSMDGKSAAYQKQAQAKQDQKIMMGAIGSKANTLSRQNEVIQRMLGNKSGNEASGNTSKITSSKEQLVSRSQMSDSIGGTPKVLKKSRLGNSQSRVIQKEMELPAQSNTIMHQKTIMGHGAGLPPSSGQTPTKMGAARKQSATASSQFSQSMSKLGGANAPVAPGSILKNSSKSATKKREADLDSVSSDEDDLADPDNLGYSKQYGNSGMNNTKTVFNKKGEKLFENPLAKIKQKEEKKATAKINEIARKEDYQTSFLAGWMMDAEVKISHEEQLERMKKKMERYAKQGGKAIQSLESGVDSSLQKPRFQSQAMRAPEERKEVKFEQEDEVIEVEVKLSPDEIAKGIEEARDSVNAPSLDLVEFEKQLKAKHDQFKAAGITPALKVLPKFKVPFKQKTNQSIQKTENMSILGKGQYEHKF